MLETPVLFLVFNRPEVTKRVFERIREVQPKQLFVAADGPREGRLGEAEKCQQVRQIATNVDWDCEVKTLFRDVNSGCKHAVSSAIDWFFEYVEEGIILEDDCLPNLSFFSFCKEMLDKYRDDCRVMQVCGSNYLGKWEKESYSYFFSLYGPIWGWATWKRFWKLYDVEIKQWPEIRKAKRYYSFCQNEEEAQWRKNLFDKIYNNEIDTWDFQLVFAKFINSGLSIIPKRNLVSNVGFNSDATHTKKRNKLANVKTYNLYPPYVVNPFVLRDYLADSKYLKEVIGINECDSTLSCHFSSMKKNLYDKIKFRLRNRL